MPDYRLHYETESEFVEVDPTGRYGRYNEVLGKGSSKTVHRAFDEIDGIEVAWYQVKVKDVLQTPEDLERLCSEVHLLKTLNHKNIIRFYSSWVDTQNRNINFITEMFTSGTLRQYRQKHKRVDVSAVKNWSRQILRGLLYLHSHDPPIIHRDLKCDNIFVNGNQGEVKIGDLGLAAILRKSHSAHSILGTPEFMAPELYEEEYNELVDIYAFGMCLLEMITFEYPYSECSNPAQIYKKVTSGKKPACLYKVKDPEVRQFVEKCLATVSRRLPARDLLMDQFLQENDLQYCFSRLSSLDSLRYDDMEEQVSFGRHSYSTVSLQGDNTTQIALPTSENWIAGHHEILKHHKVMPLPSGFEEDDLTQNVDFNVKGKKKDDDTIFLRLRIADREGRIRNIYFPFDVERDTAMSVASEMVAELDLADQDVTKIADIIDEEISALVPNWKAGVAMDDGHHPCAKHIHCSTTTAENCCGSYNDQSSTVSSESSLLEYLKSHYLVDNKCGALPCCTQVECAAMHGRFEEVTFRVGGTALSSCVAEDIPTLSTESSDALHPDAHDWLAEGDPLSPKSSASAKSDDLQSCPPSSLAGDNFRSQFNSPSPSWVDPLSDADEDSVSRELRLLAAEHQQELMELQRKHDLAILEITNRCKNRKALTSSPNRNKVNAQDCKLVINGLQEQQEEDQVTLYSSARDKKQRESDNGRRSSGSTPKSAKDSVSDPKKTTMKSSAPSRPPNRNVGPNRRLMKTHSFGEVDSELCMNYVSTEIGRLKNQKTNAAHRGETGDNRKQSHGGARHAPPVPRSFPRDHKQGRTR